MEFEVKSNGKKIYPVDFKDRVLAELESGSATAPELARRYQIPLQGIHRWRRLKKEASEASYSGAQPQAVVPAAEVRELVADYENQIKQLKRSLANMTMDRDILKDAVEIAAKKKWI